MTRLARGALALAFAAGAPPAHGLALRSGAASTAVNGLSPGRPCRLSECAKAKVSLLNTGEEPAEVRLAVTRPETSDLEDGYEPAPSAAWVRLDSSGWALEPGRTGETDGVVTVARGAAQAGQYQLNWLAEGRGPGGLRLRLRSRLLLRVDDGDDDDWRRERSAARKRPDAELRLLASPQGRRAAPLGRKAALRDLGVVVKAANAGAETLTLRARARAPAQDEVPKGYEPCPNPGWLTAPKRLAAAPGKVSELPLELEVPEQARYRGRKWAFGLDVQALESPKDEPEPVVILVETEGQAAR